MEDSMRDHRKLKAFQHIDVLVLMIYKETRAFPREEVFGLTSQMRRAAVSAAGNIVEGCARSTERDYLHCLDISLGSLRELGYHIDLATRLEFWAPDVARRVNAQYDEGARTLTGLIQSLRADN
jgi:four helix bundle protein